MSSSPPLPQFSLILTADPGEFSGYSEAAYVLRALKQSNKVSSRLPFCMSAYEGLIDTQPALVVMTGIGIMQASVCMENILNVFPDQIRRVFFLGTSGWSPAEGGVLSAPTCTSRDVRVNRIGDVCVSAASTNWDCHFCEWAPSANDTVCQLPPCHGHDREDIFGPCTPAGSTDLAAAVARHAAALKFPDMSAVLAGYTQSYWEVTGQGTRRRYAVPSAVKVLGPGQCAEATSSTLWSGLPNEMLCRQYVGSLLERQSTDRNTTQSWNSGTSPSITCVSAMEAAGWMPVLLRWQASRPERPIPFVNVRAAANYVHRPLTFDSATHWHEVQWLPDSEMQRFVMEGYEYAILTASRVVISFLESGQ